MQFRFLKNYFIHAFFGVLLLAALFRNLGTQALLADEPTRALVMLEMKLNNNLLVPTINDKPYYNKPPLFNWVLYATTELAGSEDEFWLRFPSVIGFLLLAYISYRILRKEFEYILASWVALAVLTSGRILFYDSFLGLIDPLFACCIILLFGATRKYSGDEKWVQYFIVSWLITLVAFFLKGLPALVFQVICMLYVNLRYYSFRRIFHPFQFAGFFLFLFPVVGYYYVYSLEAPLYPLLEALVKESSKRTIAENSLLKSLIHLFVFPFETLAGFLPWTFFLFLIPLREWKKLYQDARLRFWIEIILLNLLVYWLSPETRPRYLLMFVPFIILPGLFYFYYKHADSIHHRHLLTIILVVNGILVVVLFLPFSDALDFRLIPACILILFSVLLFVFRKIIKADLVLTGVAWLLVIRICFNLTIIPYRAEYDMPDVYKREALMASMVAGNRPVTIHSYTVMTNDQSFYFERERRSVLGIRHDTIGPDTLSLTYYPNLGGLKTLDSLPSAFNNSTVYLCQKEK